MPEKNAALIRDEVSDQIIDAARALVTESGAEALTVRDILHKMGTTNRVFYNRFHNIEEVLNILYQEMVRMVRRSIEVTVAEHTDFFERVHAIASQTLILSYEKKKNFSRYIFAVDSASDDNLNWWLQEISKLMAQGKQEHLLRDDLDEELVGYSIWCFIRGFNADTMARSLSLEEALKRFRFGFGLLLDGMKA